MKYYLTITDIYCNGDYYGFEDPEYQGWFYRQDKVLFEGTEEQCIKKCKKEGKSFINLLHKSIKKEHIKIIAETDYKQYASNYRDGEVYKYRIEYLKEWVDENELIFKHKSQTHFVSICVDREDRFNHIKSIGNMIDFDIKEIV